MKKVILTAVIGLVALITNAQFQWDPTITNAISTDLKEQLETKYQAHLFRMDTDKDYFIYIEEARALELFDFTHTSNSNDTFYLDITGISIFASMKILDLHNVNVTEGLGEIDTFSLQMEDLLLNNNYIEGELDLSKFSVLTYLDIKNNPNLTKVCVHPDLVNNTNLSFFKDSQTKVFTNNCQTEVYVCENKLQYVVCPDPLSTTNTVNTSNEISLFPNPVQNTLSFNKENISFVSVYSVEGVEVFTSNELVNNRIDLSSLPQGKYLVKLVTEDNVFSEMIIKE